MMGTIYILLDGVFLLLLFAYLTRNTEAGKGFWSKAYHMLLLMWMRVDIALSCGMRYVHIALETVFKGYQASLKSSESIRRKQERMREFRKAGNSADYRRRKYYNRKYKKLSGNSNFSWHYLWVGRKQNGN